MLMYPISAHTLAIWQNLPMAFIFKNQHDYVYSTAYTYTHPDSIFYETKLQFGYR